MSSNKGGYFKEDLISNFDDGSSKKKVSIMDQSVDTVSTIASKKRSTLDSIIEISAKKNKKTYGLMSSQEKIK